MKQYQKQLKKNISQLIEILKEQDAEMEIAKKIMKNNEVLIKTNKKLNAALKLIERLVLVI